MTKKKSEAAVLDLIDSFTKEGLTTIEIDNQSFDEKTELVEENKSPTTRTVQRLGNTEQLITIAPKSCRPWSYADRLETEMGNIEDLATSIKNHGQQEPILVRPIYPEENEVKFEIIFGNRRWKACFLIGIPLKAIVKPLSDQEAAICQKEENENREGLSDYSRSLSYKKLLDNGVFASLSELSAKMNIPKSTVGDLMSYHRIHPEILKAMPDLGKLKRKTAMKLAIISDKITEDTLKATIGLAPLINSGKIASSKIQQHIENSISGNTQYNSSLALIKSKYGETLFTLKSDSFGLISIAFSKITREKIPKTLIESNLTKLIEDYLSKNRGNQVSDRSDDLKKCESIT